MTDYSNGACDTENQWGHIGIIIGGVERLADCSPTAGHEMGLQYDCRQIDHRGNAFVLACLQQGLSLARKVAADIPVVESGRTIAFVATETKHERGYVFSESLLVGRTGSGLEALSELIMAVVGGQDGWFVVGESVLSRPDDESTEGWTIPMLICGQDVYPVVPAFGVSATRLREFVDCLDGLQGSLFFLVDGDLRVSGVEKRAVGPDVLDALVTGVRMVVVTAYDSEGFVIWLPESELPDWARQRYPSASA